MAEESITKAQLRKKNNCPGYVVDYLNDCGRLPVVQESKGKGYPRLYSIDAVEIVKDHIQRNK